MAQRGPCIRPPSLATSSKSHSPRLALHSLPSIIIFIQPHTPQCLPRRICKPACTAAFYAKVWVYGILVPGLPVMAPAGQFLAHSHSPCRGFLYIILGSAGHTRPAALVARYAPGTLPLKYRRIGFHRVWRGFAQPAQRRLPQGFPRFQAACLHPLYCCGLRIYR